MKPGDSSPGRGMMCRSDPWPRPLTATRRHCGAVGPALTDVLIVNKIEVKKSKTESAFKIDLQLGSGGARL